MRRKGIVILILSALLLSACGSRPVDTQAGPLAGQKENAQPLPWILRETELPDADAALADILPEGGSSREILFTMEGETLYRIVQLMGNDLSYAGSCIQRLNAPYTDWENYPAPAEGYMESKQYQLLTASLRQDQSVHMLLQDFNGNTYMAEWTADGGYTGSRIENTSLSGELLSNIRACYVDAEDTVYLSTSLGLQYFDKYFTEKKEWLDSGYVWQITGNAAAGGAPYLCGSSIDGKFRLWSVTGKQPLVSSEEVLMNYDGKVAFSNETDGFLCTPDGIWDFSVRSGQLESVMPLRSQGYAIDRIYAAAVRADGTLRIAAAVEGRDMLLEPVQDTRSGEKAELELAVLWPDSFLRQAVIDFNRQSTDYHMVLRELAEGDNYLDYQNRIQAEVSGGEGPDLLFSTVIDPAAAARKGYLRNLTADFAAQRAEMPENVRSLGEVNGESFAIPYSFSVSTLFTSSDIVGDSNSWNAEEMIQYARSGNRTAVKSYDSAQLFWLWASGGDLGTGLVHTQEGTCSLNSAEAVFLLECAGEYGDALPDFDFCGIGIAAGEVLACPVTIDSLSRVQDIHSYLRGREVYIGYPAEDGKSGNVINAFTVSVNQACKNAEGAMSFLRYLLSAQIQDKLGRAACRTGSTGFPVLSSSLENMFANAEELQEEDPYMHGAVYDSEGSYLYTREPLDGEALPAIRQLLFGARPRAQYTDTIYTILCEEAPAYYSGGKSAQEVCDIMQRRVQLFLDEQN